MDINLKKNLADKDNSNTGNRVVNNPVPPHEEIRDPRESPGQSKSKQKYDRPKTTADSPVFINDSYVELLTLEKTMKNHYDYKYSFKPSTMGFILIYLIMTCVTAFLVAIF